MDLNTPIENEKTESLILAQRRTWKRFFWWVILPGMVYPLSYITIIIPIISEVISNGLWKPRPAYYYPPLGIILFLLIMAVGNFSPFIALALLGKNWLGINSSEPLDPATFYERKVALIGATLPASALGLWWAHYIIFPHNMEIGFIFFPFFATVSIFIVSGLGLIAGWIIGRGSQTSR